MKQTLEIILASTSPRRKELLERLGVDFTVLPPQVDESIGTDTSPGDAVAELALKKAKAAAAMRPLGADGAPTLVIAADTIVVEGGEIFGKPADRNDAARMLRRLSGREHQVMTGLAVVCGERESSMTVVSDVYFRQLEEREIWAYIDTGEPMDKAGAYGAQGRGGAFIYRIDGDFFSVMGLPLCGLSMLLGRYAVTIFPGEDKAG